MESVYEDVMSELAEQNRDLQMRLQKHIKNELRLKAQRDAALAALKRCINYLDGELPPTSTTLMRVVGQARAAIAKEEST